MNDKANSDCPPAAKTVLAGETDLDKVKPGATGDATPPATPKPAPVKDDKWLETEIAVAEDKLHTLRQQHAATKAATKPAATPTRRKTGFECEDLL